MCYFSKVDLRYFKFQIFYYYLVKKIKMSQPLELESIPQPSESSHSAPAAPAPAQPIIPKGKEKPGNFNLIGLIFFIQRVL